MSESSQMDTFLKQRAQMLQDPNSFDELRCHCCGAHMCWVKELDRNGDVLICDRCYARAVILRLEEFAIAEAEEAAGWDELHGSEEKR